MKITWYTTNTLKIEQYDSVLWIDPFIPMKEKADLPPWLKAEAFLITHGHFDHLSGLELISLIRSDARVYGTAVAAKTLARKKIGSDFHLIQPLDRFVFESLNLEIYQGKHIHFDARLVAQTLNPVHLSRYKENFFPVLKRVLSYPEAGETICALIKAEEASVFIMGSLSLDDQAIYPQGMDLLVLPWQGSSFLEEIAVPVIQALKPKKIMLSHFDDSFPPLTRKADLSGFEQMMKTWFPSIPWIIPEPGIGIEIQPEK